MGRRCCIAGCNSTSRLPEHHGVTYHSFPLDMATRAVWIRNTRLSSDRQITKSVLVCSRHFRRADFQPQRSGKYLLKQRVFPTVFPWGKVDPVQVETDAEQLKTSCTVTTNVVRSTTSTGTASTTPTTEDATKATVEATVAQIMAETAELNAAGGLKSNSSNANADVSAEGTGEAAAGTSNSTAGVKFEAVTAFNPGTRLEAQDFDGIWHVARVVEVDNDDREVLIKFERTGKNKSAVVGTEEWIPMNSSRLRQKVSTKPVPVFELEEKCMARWSGPRKFPGTVKKILGNAMYEVLFDDGYVKNVRAIHMNKILSTEDESVANTSATASPVTVAAAHVVMPRATTPIALSTDTVATTTSLKTAKKESPATSAAPSSSNKKRAPPGPRKDWPLLDMSKLDLDSLNLPEIPRDGEWTCHWVNDQPIGREGFLIVGEHRKPTVIVDDWRLPPGWVKHMYQRSNVLGKWDVILVTPNNKRFRSKADLKVFLEEQGQVYNPDIYDFSIHRRRAKDINAYVYTTDYTPQQTAKPKASESVIELSALDATPLLTTSSSKYIETPVATPVPPMELMTPPSQTTKSTEDTTTMELVAELVNETPNITSTPVVVAANSDAPIGDGFAYIGGLKVQIIENLFRCPQEGCSKNFRKENHLQIHIKHYHHNLVKLLGECPKMLDLAEKRTHIKKPDQHEPTPKNQIPNQQFFAKLHQQDLQQTRTHRKSLNTTVSGATTTATLATDADIKNETDIKTETDGADMAEMSANTTADSSVMDSSLGTIIGATTPTVTTELPRLSPKRARFSPRKSTLGSRKSNRQRTTRRYLTAAQATAGIGGSVVAATLPAPSVDSNFGVADFEETRHSFNATPDTKMLGDAKKRKSSAAPATPLSSLDSPVTADSGSSSFQPLLAPSSNEADAIASTSAQYIKENGELIKIVRMRQEEIINCLCSYGEEDGLMIQCELCLCWQHGACNGIDKESDVPDKYVCYICRNPQCARESMRFKHDQDWLYEGKLPVANYHIANPLLTKRFDFLKKSHTVTGNLIELKRFAHSLRVKMNIANNRVHPKLYLWAKKWDDEQHTQLSDEIKTELDIKQETQQNDLNKTKDAAATTANTTPTKKIKLEPATPVRPIPNIPQPEAPIDPVECQHRLLEHIKVQQDLVMNRLANIEAEIDELERQDELPDLLNNALNSPKDVLATFIKELDVMKQIAKINTLENTKQSTQNQIAIK